MLANTLYITSHILYWSQNLVFIPIHNNLVALVKAHGKINSSPQLNIQNQEHVLQCSMHNYYVSNSKLNAIGENINTVRVFMNKVWSAYHFPTHGSCTKVYMLHSSYTMCTRGLPDTYTHTPWAVGVYRRQGKIHWAKFLQFQCHQSFHGYTFMLPWP